MWRDGLRVRGEVRVVFLLDEWVVMTHSVSMGPADALVEVRRLAALDRVEITYHAAVDRFQRHHGVEHIHCALRKAREIRESKPDQQSDWVVTGPDLDGDDLDAAIIIEADVVVITVF